MIKVFILTLSILHPNDTATAISLPVQSCSQEHIEEAVDKYWDTIIEPAVRNGYTSVGHACGEMDAYPVSFPA